MVDNVVVIQQNDLLWKLFLAVFIFMMIIILITFTFGLWKSLRRKHGYKDNKSVVESSSLTEQLFFSAQQIVLGKNSTVYRTILDNDIVALKVYNQTNILMWKNEVSSLKSIKHESIIRYVNVTKKSCLR